MNTLVRRPFSLDLYLSESSVLLYTAGGIRLNECLSLENYDTNQTISCTTDDNKTYIWDTTGNSRNGVADDNLICFVWEHDTADETPSKSIGKTYYNDFTIIQIPFNPDYLNCPGYHLFTGKGKRIANGININGGILTGTTEGGMQYDWYLDGTIIDGCDEDNLLMFTWDEAPSKEIVFDKSIIQVLSGGEADTTEEIQPSVSYYKAPGTTYTDADVEVILADETEEKLLVRLVWDSTDAHLRSIRDNMELHNMLIPNKPVFLYKYGYCSDYYQNIIALLGAIKQDTLPLNGTVILELYKAIDKCLHNIYAERYPVATDEIAILSTIELQTYVVAMSLVRTNLLSSDWDEPILEIMTELNSRAVIEENEENEPTA